MFASPSVLNKVIAIHNLDIPYELCDHINSFCFYDEYQAKVKNLKKILNQKISSSFCGNANSGHWWFEAAVYDESNSSHETQFQASNCTRCGNYTHGNNFALAANNSICICNETNLQNIGLTYYEETQEGLYWINDDSEVDPIETAYAEWREYWDSDW